MVTNYLQILDRLADLLHMAGDADLAPDGADDALRVDKEGRAFDAHVPEAIHVLFHIDAEPLTDIGIFVGSEGKIQIVFFAELLVALQAVLRNADDGNAQFLEGGQVVAEAAGFGGAAGGIVLWIKIKREKLALESGAADFADNGRGHIESGNRLSDHSVRIALLRFFNGGFAGRSFCLFCGRSGHGSQFLGWSGFGFPKITPQGKGQRFRQFPA
jgi:hypothetical protein